MVQRRRGLGLALKASQRLRIFGDIVRQEFEGHEAAQLQILGLVHHAHATAAQLFDGAVVRDRLPNH